MPRREYARIGTDMPDEPSIKALGVGSQWLYDRMLMRPEMSRCGIIPHRPALWADLADDATEAKVRRWVQPLTDRRHVIIDDRYAEAFVRTYVRHDGLLGQPNVVANMCSDYSLIASDRLRTAFLAEFRRLWDVDLTPGERGGWLLAVGVYPELKVGGGSWPQVLPGESLDRLRKALKDTGILGPFLEAIRKGSVDPFTEASPKGLPEPLALAAPNPSPNPLRGGDRGESRVPSPERQSRAPSANPHPSNPSPLSSNGPYRARPAE